MNYYSFCIFKETLKIENMMYPTDLMLGFIENVAHPVMKGVGIDMDAFQMYVFKNVPEPSWNQILLIVALATVFWFAVFKSLDFVVIRPFMHSFRKQFPSVEHWHAFDEKAKVWYASYWFGIIHALFSVVTSGYCFIYADGQKGTTWFHSK